MRGFSLVELSIVLVILGLLTGGIMAGQSLIQGAKIRSTLADFDKMETAINNFRQKYSALPGDIADATRYWGAGSSCPSNSTGGTCDGNGNGQITCAPDYTGCEMTYVAQHLVLAGMIEGSFNPNWPLVNPLPLGQYAYPTKLNSHSLLAAWSDAYAPVWYNNFGYAHYLYLGTLSTSSYFSGYIQNSVACEDALRIDGKMDDGKPGTGEVMSGRTQCVTDTTGANFTTAEYDPRTTAGLTILAKKLP